MKKSALLIIVLFFTTMAFSQVNTIRIPDAQATITADQIIANGKAAQQNANRDVMVLNFEGMGDGDQILNYYNGGLSGYAYGPGPNLGVYFNDAALTIIGGAEGGTGNFSNEPSPRTIMFFLSGNASVMNVPAGFTNGFSFYYASYYGLTVYVYDGLDGTGNLLATESFPANAPSDLCPPGSYGTYCHWDPVGVPFAGTAKSVSFSGVANYCGFDDVTFGSVIPGPETVPVSNWALFIGIGLIFIAAFIRFRRLF